MDILLSSSDKNKASRSCFILLVLVFKITRFETVESFPFHISVSSTSLLAKVLQEENSEITELVEPLQRRWIDDCTETEIHLNVIRFCASINSLSPAGYSWGVSSASTNRSIKLILGSPRIWFVWKAILRDKTVFMFGLKSTEHQGKYYFVQTIHPRKKIKLILSEPLPSPGNNFQSNDSRCFELLSSSGYLSFGLRHVATGLLITNKSNDRKIRLKNQEFGRNYRFKMGEKQCKL